MSDYPFERTNTVYPAGTLLQVRAYGFIRHYGIATGYGTVIHSSARFGRVEETDMQDFSNGNKVFPISGQANIDGAELVARARLRKGQRYNALFNNCQHFVTWVIEGKSRSEQLGPLDARRLSRE
ncbi:lecithin:retinol acyltransferase [Litorimonas taeanensis]|uniref:Lecithin:retinol acyltransferase n=1 Tax=Litorimonas taeanensis TaxID=568099 RepID=A0A420WEH3_9PROT|nr:lecithin retinol acyltransferase family protein [Litorimonas taeanensis]RKQ69335.1 lecithin:retinol acyltransferase [Litorimonas taeanensis]